jgi:hypothetical protein
LWLCPPPREPLFVAMSSSSGTVLCGYVLLLGNRSLWLCPPPREPLFA